MEPFLEPLGHVKRNQAGEVVGFVLADFHDLFDQHMTRDIMDPGHLVPQLPQELRRFILKCARCDPDRRFQDVDEALASLKPLAHLINWPTGTSSTAKKKMSSLSLTYTDENHLELARLVEAFQAKARDMGVQVNFKENRDL